MDTETELTRVFPPKTVDPRSSGSETGTINPTNLNAVIIPYATENALRTTANEVQFSAEVSNLQGRNVAMNGYDRNPAQSINPTEQIQKCTGAKGRWRTAIQFPFLFPIGFIVGIIVGLYRVIFSILRIVIPLALILIFGPVALVIWAFKGFPLRYRYSPLRNPRKIRLVQVQPGSGSDKVHCTIIEGSWDSSSYEALSYAWGIVTSNIEVNGKTLRASLSLRQALIHLRDAQSTRTIWIDALCINQKDEREKSEQVQQMREIYARARRVIVWLGEDPGCIGIAFQQVTALANATAEELPNILNTPGPWRESLKEILHHRWWGRIWIIQEVAVAREIIVQCGDHTLAWDDLCLLLMRSEMRVNLEIQDELYRFVVRVKYLRETDIDPKYRLLSLVYDFRNKKATVPHDKIYALHGLIKTGEHSPTRKVNYSQTPKLLWQNFAKEYINRYGSLLMLALVDTYDYSQGRTAGSSWCIDWSTKVHQAEESRQPLWDGGLSDQVRYSLGAKYSAAGGAPALCQTKLPDPDVISVKGFVYDTVVAVGVGVSTSKSTKINFWHIFEQWESFSGGPWTSDDIDLQNIFNETLTVGNWTKQPNDWRYWSSKEQEGRNKDDLLEYNRLRKAACSGRRLFITENGSIGLGHLDVKVGDIICVLLGANVPFILRKQKHSGPGSLSLHYLSCTRWKHLNCCITILHKIVGQAYIHSLMQYKGNIRNDIKTKKLVLDQFFLE